MNSNDPFSLRLLRYLPRNLLSRTFGRIARVERPRWFPQWLIRIWIEKFKVAIEEAERPPAEYSSLLAFFTRALKSDARPIDTASNVVVCPVDGALGALGRIEGDTLLQAKGMPYRVAALLGSEEAAKAYHGGSYVTVYLSPRDYHRIHCPVDGTLSQALYEPGTLWPVNPPAVKRIPALFAVNERISLLIDTPNGQLALVLVGATNVGSIRLAFTDFATNRAGTRTAAAIECRRSVVKGEHLATFELGSTIVLLLPPGMQLDTMWPATPVRMGRRIGQTTLATP